MKQKINYIKEYITKNMTDLPTRCNFISRVLIWVIFSSLGIFIIEAILGMILVAFIGDIPDWADKILGIMIIIPGYILGCSAKVFLLVIPFTWLIQCWYCIRNREFNSFVIKNLVVWIIIGLFSLFHYDFHQREDKCMERCVLPDKSNYTECANSICDFPI